MEEIIAGNWEMEYKGHIICGETLDDGTDDDIMACFDVIEDFGEDPNDYCDPYDLDDHRPESFTPIGCESVEKAMMLIEDVVNGTIKDYIGLISSPFAL